MQLVGAASPATLGQALQLELEVGEHAGVEQLAQLLGAEQVAQQVAVERQRRGPPLGQRRVALVHVRGDPVEQQALRERRRLGGVDADHAHLRGCAAGRAPRAAPARRTRPAGTRGWSPAGSGRSGTWPPRPAGRRPAGAAATAACAVGPAAGQQQGPGRALAEAGREQRGLRQGGDDELVDVVGVDQQLVEGQLVGGLGQADDDAVVAPHRLDRHVVPLHQPPLDGHRPRRVHRACRTG